MVHGRERQKERGERERQGETGRDREREGREGETGRERETNERKAFSVRICRRT